MSVCGCSMTCDTEGASVTGPQLRHRPAPSQAMRRTLDGKVQHRRYLLRRRNLALRLRAVNQVSRMR